MQTWNREKASGIHIVSTVKSKFPGKQAQRISDKVQEEEMQCKVCDAQIHLFHTWELKLMEEVWSSEMGKECFVIVCLLQRG